MKNASEEPKTLLYSNMRKIARWPDESTDLVPVREPVRLWSFAALTLQITDVLHPQLNMTDSVSRLRS